MEMKKTIKKIMALAGGAIMAGATLAGAFAALQDLPQPFVTSDGVFDAYVVVGTMGLVDDVAVGMDVAAAFAQKATSAASENGGSTTTVSGGMLVHAPGTDLNYNDHIADVLTTGISGDDLSLFATHNFVDNVGDNQNNVQYTQKLTFNNNNAKIIYNQDTSNDSYPVDTYLKLGSSNDLYTYTLKFDNAVMFNNTSTTSATNDLQGTALTIQGKEYTISKVIVDSNKISEIDLLSGAVETTQGEYTTQTYTLNGKTYSVYIPIISDSDNTVMFEINGETTTPLSAGQTYTLSDGTVIGVKWVMPNEGSEAQGADQVAFYLGADKVQLINDSAVKVNGKELSNYDTNTLITQDTNGLKEIDISLTPSDDHFIKVGDSWTDPIFGQWKIDFTGIDKKTEDITSSVSGKDGSLTFTALDGKEVKVPVKASPSGTGSNSGIWFGDRLSEDKVYINQSDSFAQAQIYDHAGMFLLNNGDSCVVGDSLVSTTDQTNITKCKNTEFLVATDSGNAHVFKITKISLGDDKIVGGTGNDLDTYDVKDLTTGTDYKGLEFGKAQDVGIGGIELDVAYINATYGSGSLVDGNDNDTVLTAKMINNYTATGTFKTHGGAIGVLAEDSDVAGNYNATAVFSITDQGASKELGGWYYTMSSDNVKIKSDSDGIASAYVPDWMALYDGASTSVALDKDSWGAIFTWDTDNNNHISMSYPVEKAKMDVYIAPTGATTTTTTSGAVNVNYINPASGVARVDNDFAPNYMPDKPVILIGGPGANKMVLDLADKNMTDAVADYTPDTAIIQLIEGAYGDKDALIIAGYAAKDTKAAGKVVDGYILDGQYADLMQGDKVTFNTTTYAKVE